LSVIAQCGVRLHFYRIRVFRVHQLNADTLLALDRVFPVWECVCRHTDPNTHSIAAVV